MTVPQDVSAKTIKRITCIGSGFVGGPTSAVIAFKSNVEVTVVDVDADRIAAWQSSTLPMYEPGLDDMVRVTSTRNGSHDGGKGIKSLRPANLFFSTDIDQAIESADLIFICVNTPSKANVTGGCAVPDLAHVEDATRNIARVAKTNKIVVEKSTVPCRTAQSIREILATNANPGVYFDVLSNPEFLAEGTAIRNLLFPDRVIIGSMPDPQGERAASSLLEVYAQWISRDRIITMNLWSAELSKLAANAMLAQRISSVNALSAICEATGANVNEVSHACGLDSRIGPHMLQAGPGFGGSCFQKDIFNIVYLSESLHLDEVADYWRAIIGMNEHQKRRFAKRITSCLGNNLTAKKLAVLGFAFKPDTSDTRESPAITLVCSLVSEGAQVTIYDPKVEERQIWKELENNGAGIDTLRAHVQCCSSAYDACKNANAVVVVTEWAEFSDKSRVDKAVPMRVPMALAKLDPNRLVSSDPLLSPSGKRLSSALLVYNVQDDRAVREVFPKEDKQRIVRIERFQRSKRSHMVYFGSHEEAESALSRQPSENKRGKAPQTDGQSRKPYMRFYEERNLSIAKALPSDIPCRTQPPFHTRLCNDEKPSQQQSNNSCNGEETRSAARLDWVRIAEGMRKPMYVFDGRNILDAAKLEALGFRVEAIGRASTKQ